jgi:hypothetical protein
MYVRYAHVHYKNESQRQRSHCNVLCVRASYILHILLVQYILHTQRSFICNCIMAESFA